MSHHPPCIIEKAKQIVSVCLKVQEHFHKAAEKGHPSGKQCYNCTKKKGNTALYLLQEVEKSWRPPSSSSMNHKVKEVFIKDSQGQSLHKCVVVKMQLNLHSSAAHVFPFIPFGSSAHTVGSKCRFQRK